MVLTCEDQGIKKYLTWKTSKSWKWEGYSVECCCFKMSYPTHISLGKVGIKMIYEENAFVLRSKTATTSNFSFVLILFTLLLPACFLYLHLAYINYCFWYLLAFFFLLFIFSTCLNPFDTNSFQACPASVIQNCPFSKCSNLSLNLPS